MLCFFSIGKGGAKSQLKAILGLALQAWLLKVFGLHDAKQPSEPALQSEAACFCAWTKVLIPLQNHVENERPKADPSCLDTPDVFSWCPAYGPRAPTAHMTEKRKGHGTTEGERERERV